MIEIKDNQIIIQLNHFTLEEIIESAIEVHQNYYLEKDTLMLSYPEQRFHYLLLELVKAGHTNQQK